MAEKEIFSKQAINLRRQAEEKAAKIAENQKALSSEETRQMLHEIQVHQIELEMQNEELRTAQADLDAARARYFDLYDLAPVGYCTISEKGLILESTTAQDADSAPLCRFVLSDITEHKRAEAEKAELEVQNRQLQKAESLGRMAGAC